MLFLFLFFFTKLDQMSRVGSRGRHPKCRPKKGVWHHFHKSEKSSNIESWDCHTWWRSDKRFILDEMINFCFLETGMVHCSKTFGLLRLEAQKVALAFSLLFFQCCITISGKKLQSLYRSSIDKTKFMQT